jgi:hypothetical protein
MSDDSLPVSKRLLEVWEWKDAIAREVAQLPIEEALAEIMRKAKVIAETVDLPRCDPSIFTKSSVAEKVS